MALCRCVAGYVIKEGTSTGQQGLTVQLGTQSGRSFRPLAEARTDKLGHFAINLTDFVATGRTGNTYTIRVLDGVTRLKAHGDLSWGEGIDAGDLMICVEYPAPCAETPFETGIGGTPEGVFGQVRHADGTPLAGLTVKLLEVGYDDDTELDSDATTDANGVYEFSAPSGAPGSHDLRVKVMSDSDYLSSSVVYYRASFPLRIDLSVCDDALRGPSEFQRISDAINALVTLSSLPDTLAVRRLAWFSGKTGWSLDRLTDWEIARRLSDPSKLNIGWEPLYGLFREGFPRNSDGVLARSVSAVRRAIYVAIKANIISSDVEIEVVLTQIAAARVAAFDSSDADALGAILHASSGQAHALNDNQITEFCTYYATFEGTDADFWAGVADLSYFVSSGTAVVEARRLIALGTIGLNYAPCVRAMLVELGTSPAKETGGWSIARWDSIAGNTTVLTPLPGGLAGDTDDEKRAALSELLRENAQLAYPQHAVVSGLVASTTFNLSSTFFGLNPTVDLQTTRLHIGRDDLNFGTTDPGEKAAILEELRQAQRLLRVSPSVGSVEVMETLFNKGYTSARTIARTGRSRFIESYGDATTHATAVEIFQKAQSQTAMAAAFFLQAHPSLSRMSLGFIADSPENTSGITEDDVPGWSDLFGNLSGCRCRQCRSIHGPAAYLVDLLHWLGTKTKPAALSSDPDAPATALAVLTVRRPDIAALPLTCENTERVLPYIDLSLEILEAVVAEDALDLNVRSTEVETPELLAAPQYIIDAAYDTLGTASKAAKTPFHRPLVEMRTFLRHLGVDRTDLMRDFKEVATPAAPTDAQIAYEELGLSAEAALLLTTPGGSSEGDYWPLLSLSTAPSVRAFRRAAELSYPDILDLLHTRTVNPDRTDMVKIVITGSDPYDVDAYLVGRADGASADPPSDTEFSAMRQFLRLWRATGWTLLEMDKVLYGLGNTDPSAWTSTAPLENVGNIHRLIRMTHQGPLEIASWFAVLDTWQDRTTTDTPVLSKYDRTYLSTSLFPISEIEGTVTDGTTLYQTFPFALNADRTDVDTTSLIYTDALTLTDHQSRLHAVLGVDESEVATLIAYLSDIRVLDTYDADPGSLDPLDHITPSVTLANLTRLYRWCSLGRALGIKPTEAFRFARLLGVAPSFNEMTADIDEGLFTSPAMAISFMEDVQDLQGAHWDADTLDYLIYYKATDRVAPTDDVLSAALGQIRDALRAAYSTPGAGVTLASLIDDLGRRVAEAFKADRAVMDALRGRDWSAVAGAPSGALLRLPSAEWAPITVGSPIDVTVFAGASFRLTSDTYFTPIGGTSGVIISGTVFVLEDTDAPIEIEAGTVVQLPVQAGLRIDGATPYTFVTGNITTLASGNIASFPGGVAVVLADGRRGTFDSVSPTTLVNAVDITFTTSATVGLPDALSGSDVLRRMLRTAFWDVAVDTSSGNPWADIQRHNLSDTTYEDDFNVLEALARAILLIQKLDANQEEQQAWYSQISVWSLLEPAWLAPMDITDDHSDAFARLKNTIDLFVQRARLPGSAPTFAEIIVSPTATNLSARTGWDATALETLTSWMGTASVAGLNTLLDRMDTLRRVGATAETVAGWSCSGLLSSIGSDKGREVVAAARSRYTDPNAWAVIARPIRDGVRKAQRDALVSYLIAREASDQIADADAIYEKYLIDVSMNPEMLTSRIKQAACSVQLFIHRCMFGIEQFTTAYNMGDWFNDDDRAEWEWMRTYRVWEAARKVFLYPENWIEPELRSDKTPFFDTLEKELAQGDITDDRVEDTVLAYLDRLHEVSNLKVLAFYVQKETDDDGTIDNLHVFARTRSEPPTYWYRRRENSATWTAWEKVDAGIQGDQLVPVIYNRRLMLLWGEFTQSQSDTENAAIPSWWDVRIASSEYRSGKWSPKKVSTDALQLNSSVLGSLLPNEPLNYYNLLSSIDDEGVLVLTLLVVGNTTAVHIVGPGSYWCEVGTFTLDLCTMDMVVSEVTAIPTSRMATDPALWSAPGFLTLDSSFSGYGSLDIYSGGYDSTGEPDGMALPVTLLGTMTDATVVVPSQWNDFVSQSPFFVSAGGRAYFVVPGATDITTESVDGLSSSTAGTGAEEAEEETLSTEEAEQYSKYINANAYASASAAVDAITNTVDILMGVDDSGSLSPAPSTYRFYNFYHPHICRYIKEVRRSGVFGLMDPDPNGTASELFRQQLVTSTDKFDFEMDFAPTTRVEAPYPIEDIDFSENGAYSQYNWEIFFHLPFFLASRLAESGKHQEAISWFHTVFDPRTRTPPPDGYPDSAQWWKVNPFLEAVSVPVVDWIAFTGENGDTSSQEAFERQVAAWRADPFDPHLIARMRPGTYQKSVVMRYIETLIDWGDQCFTRDTIESLNEATQLYVFAKKVLGDRPEELEAPEEPEAKSYNDLASDLDAFGNALVALENAGFPASGYGSTSGSGASQMDGLGYTTYFCIPPNTKLLSYWDTVADRLFKIRNGMNIEGVVRSLPLFEPPIDPAMLVRAAAAGVDIGSALDSLATSLPNHRFNVMLGRAQALTNTIKGLGQALLSALEKRDAEALALLRQTQEESLLDAMTEIKEKQIEEAKENLQAIKKTKAMVQARRDYYDGLIQKGEISEETQAKDRANTSANLDYVAAGVQGISTIFSAFPEFFAGTIFEVETGGAAVHNVLSATATELSIISGLYKTEVSRLTTAASYRRRTQEWQNQLKLAKKELDQIEKQISAAEIRIDIAKKELHNHQLQISNSAQIKEWMERKYTNGELYDWMVTQLAPLHFQAYQLALSMAKKAETCFRFELGRSSDTFIQPVYWDGLRKGLLAGDRLAADLDRMDTAYLEKDVREFELLKHVSLARLDALALQLLKTGGECWFEVPEAWFNADCPGHYFRRIQSVALSIACVSGTISTINAQLTLHGHLTRMNTTDAPTWTNGDYTSIVTSVAVNDAGLFSADLRDPRYLPFERRGAISRWHLRLTAQTWKQLDWESIADVTLHLRYTARDGGAMYRGTVETTLLAQLGDVSIGFPSSAYSGPIASGAGVAFSAKRDASDAFDEAQQDETGDFILDLDETMFPGIAGYHYTRIMVIPISSTDTVTVSVDTVSWSSSLSGMLGDLNYSIHTFSGNIPFPSTVTVSLPSSTMEALTDILIILLPPA